MDWLHDTISKFGQNMGLDALALDEHGFLQLNFEQWGQFCLELIGTDLLVYLSRPIPQYDDKAPRRALQLCHYSEGWTWLPNVALTDDEHLLFAMRLQATDVSLPNLEKALEQLNMLHDRL